MTFSSLHMSLEDSDWVVGQELPLSLSDKVMVQNQQPKHFHWPGRQHQPLPLKTQFKGWSYSGLVIKI